MNTKFKFLGKMSIAKSLLYNLISFAISNVIIFFWFRESFKYTFFVLLIFFSLSVLEMIIKQRQSPIILTEYDFRIIEYKFFGLIKINKRFDIYEDERKHLVEYFQYLTENKKEFSTFSIQSLNKILDKNIKFKNTNRISQKPLDS